VEELPEPPQQASNCFSQGQRHKDDAGDKTCQIARNSRQRGVSLLVTTANRAAPAAVDKYTVILCANS